MTSTDCPRKETAMITALVIAIASLLAMAYRKVFHK
jgi:hypothetical protein